VLIGTTLTAASAGVFNQVLERDFDRLMPRTRNRPLAARRVGLTEATLFGLVLGVAGVAWLTLKVNPLTALLGLVTFFTYLFLYTPMKRRTHWCTLVGAVPGAIPPVMGVTAFDNAITPTAICLFAILFFWQMPHFFALALMYRDDYQRGGFRMLPGCTDGTRRTRAQIVYFTTVLLGVSLLPIVFAGAGVLYAIGAIAAGTLFMRRALACAHGVPNADRKLFFASLIYLPAVLAALMIDV
jgi:protoheme IX farnesyltransferase